MEETGAAIARQLNGPLTALQAQAWVTQRSRVMAGL